MTTLSNAVGVTVRAGASIGARAVCVLLVADTRDRWTCPVTGEVNVEREGRLEEPL